jgi:homoserine kinase type II
MAAKTLFSDQDFDDLLSQYALGTYICSEPITQGTIQTNYFVQTTRGKYVFRFYENRSKESVLFEANLLAYLKKHAYPCPTPFKNIHGKWVGLYQNKPYVFFEFINGRHIAHPDDNQKQQLIQKAAELQNLTRNYHPRYKKYRWNYDIELCRTLAQIEAAKTNTKNGYDKLAWLESQLAAIQLPRSLPKGICHCDFHFSNVLFQENKFAALIDFDDANYTFLLFDLVGLIESWAWPHPSDTLDLTQARLVVREYNKHRPLATIEKRHLFDIYKLSILFDGVWFFGRGTVENLYEKRKIEALSNIGRNKFFEALFSE